MKKLFFFLLAFVAGFSAATDVMAQNTCGSVLMARVCKADDGKTGAIAGAGPFSACSLRRDPMTRLSHPINFCPIQYKMAGTDGANKGAASTPSKPVNPYDKVFDFEVPGHEAEAKAAKEFARSEDETSPFAVAHGVEEARYEYLYKMKYAPPFESFAIPSFLGPDMKPQPLIEVLPPSTDSNGHPLWFDGAAGMAHLADIVKSLFYYDRFDELDRLFDVWNNSSERTADGRWKLSAFDAMFPALSSKAEWDNVHKFIERWRAKSPRSAAAALTDASYWQQYAWNARGRGYTNSVTADGWALFRERLEHARTILLQSVSYTGSTPLWGQRLLEAESDLGWSKQDVIAFYQEQTHNEKRFLPLYFTVAGALTPKWGGSWDAVEVFARDAVRKTFETDGHAMYARIYWHVVLLYQDPNSNIFTYTKANWADIKQGFDDVVRAYPHSAYDLNKYAAAACMADDKATFQSLRFQIGQNIFPDVWPDGYSLDLCEHKFALQPL